jgi:hypothetical protein
MFIKFKKVLKFYNILISLNCQTSLLKHFTLSNLPKNNKLYNQKTFPTLIPINPPKQNMSHY